MNERLVGGDEALVREHGQPLLHGVPVLGDGRLLLLRLGVVLQRVEEDVGAVVALAEREKKVKGRPE